MQALRLACCSGGRWATAASAARCCWATPARPRTSAATRASATKASSIKVKGNNADELEPESPRPLPELFDLQQRDAPLFPELLTPGTRAVLLGVDPDIHGALALLSWNNPPACSCGHTCSTSSDNSGSSSSSIPWPALADLQLTVHDMPVELWEQSSRAKKHPSAAGIASLLRQELEWGNCPASVSGLGQVDAAVAERQQPTVMRAVVEYSPPLHMSGKHAWYGIGFSMGLLNGLLVSMDVPYQRVHSSVWKKQMGLYRQGKEGSLALARQAFPVAAATLLRRKKDHGRAEALLVAAYGLGVRAAPLKAALSGAGVAAAEGDAGGRVLDDDLIQIST